MKKLAETSIYAEMAKMIMSNNGHGDEMQWDIADSDVAMKITFESVAKYLSIVKVKDKVNGYYKEIKINDISICREADAALYWKLKDSDTLERPVGIVNIGFRSTELAYFDKSLTFIDKKSDTIEFGNRSVMNNVKDKLLNKGIIKDVNEIDTSDDYNELKERAYKLASENIDQLIEERWINLDEMDIYLSGGTSLNMNFDERFKVIEDAQMATAKGCWLVGSQRF